MKNRVILLGAIVWGLLGLLLLGVLVYFLVRPAGVNDFWEGIGVSNNWTEASLIREAQYSAAGLEAFGANAIAENVVVRLVPGDTIAVRQYGNPDRQEAFEADEGGGRLTISLRDSRKWWQNIFSFGTWNSRLEIDLPAGYGGDVALSSASGEILLPEDVKPVWGQVELRTVSGEIRAEAGLDGRRFTVSTTSGGLRLGPVTAESGFTAHSVSGSLRLTAVNTQGTASLRTTSGSIQAETLSCLEYDVHSISGGVSFTAGLSGQGNLKTTSGSIRVTGAALTGGVSVHSTSGSVQFGLTAGQGCELRMSSVSGSLRCEQPLLSDGGESRGNETAGRVGDGGPPLTISTTSGSIRVE
ncbi:MAG: DUF4097 domain-containing protein [Oscillospiraceae bacterium]|jgi:hypothetical protein|nr:DUF4097 domain-containing protein [Oscillospiraceae bacterium]